MCALSFLRSSSPSLSVCIVLSLSFSLLPFCFFTACKGRAGHWLIISFSAATTGGRQRASKSLYRPKKLGRPRQTEELWWVTDAVISNRGSSAPGSLGVPLSRTKSDNSRGTRGKKREEEIEEREEMGGKKEEKKTDMMMNETRGKRLGEKMGKRRKRDRAP